jgi:DNA polymerase-1
VSSKAHEGFIKALDGRKLPIRHKHAALNTLLQSAGSIVCKYWIIYFHDILKERGYIDGVDYKQNLWIHDEIVVSYTNKLTHEELQEISKTAMNMAGTKLKIRMPLDISAASGMNYSEIH